MRQSPVLVRLFSVWLVDVELLIVRLLVARSKQGLQEGISEFMLRWESPKVQWRVEGGRRGRRRMRTMHGRRIKVEMSMVVFSWRRSFFLKG